MRVATWESSAGALAALLNATASTELAMADLYTITLLTGQVLRYTAGEATVIVNGVTYTAGPQIIRNGVKLAVGVTVDSLNLQISDDGSTLVNSVPLIQFISTGGLTNARVTLQRLFAGPTGAPVGTLQIFSGRVGNVTGGRHQKTVEVRSDLELLNIMLPRAVYQPGCMNTLYDNYCNANRSAFTVAANARSTTDATQAIFNTTLNQTTGWFDQGVITFTSGLNNGISRTVKRFNSASNISVAQPWPEPVALNDTFTIVAGCDHTQGTCTTKFSNAANFRGMPYLPPPDVIT